MSELELRLMTPPGTKFMRGLTAQEIRLYKKYVKNSSLTSAWADSLLVASKVGTSRIEDRSSIGASSCRQLTLKARSEILTPCHKAACARRGRSLAVGAKAER